MNTTTAIVLGALAVVVLAGGAAASGGGATDMGTSTSQRKAALYAALRVLPQLTEDQRLFLMLVAYGESNYRASSHNDSPGEVAASRSAWQHNPTLAAKLTELGHGGEAAWCIGSGGYGGRLVPYFGDDMLDASMSELALPGNVFVPAPSIVSSILTAHKLQQLSGWRTNPTVGNLRIGYWGTAKMGASPDAKRIEKYRKHAEKVGLGRAFVDRVLTEFPGASQSREIYMLLRAHGVR